jgi:signal transduction histidine kinase
MATWNGRLAQTRTCPMNTNLSTATLIDRLIHAVALPSDLEDERLRKAVLTFLSAMTILAGALWGVMYVALGITKVALIPFGYAVVSTLGLLYFLATKRYRLFLYGELSLLMLLPFLVHWCLGGFVVSGGVMLWAILAPIGALMFDPERRALGWFLTFLVLTVASGLFDPLLRPHAVALPEAIIALSYVMNFACVSMVFYVLLRYFVRALRQVEALLMQREKLAALGTLAAGVAHELNNPAAAVQRSVAHLDEALGEWERAAAGLRELALDRRQLELLQGLEGPAAPTQTATYLQEEEVEAWLEANDVERAWELAPALAPAGWDPGSLERLAKQVPPAQLPGAVRWLAARAAVRAVLAEVKQGAARVSGIVKAVKAYSYLDQAPAQDVDVHESLENTLVMLHHKINTGISVVREYGSDVPRITAHGAQLNQVWTNLVDNAIDAMAGQGRLTLRTYTTGGSVVVEIADSGSGIPPEVRPHIFEPFYTTKGPGAGSGLGLYITYDIIRKHGGRIHATSVPGATCFHIVLPVGPEAPTAGAGTQVVGARGIGTGVGRATSASEST